MVKRGSNIYSEKKSYVAKLISKDMNGRTASFLRVERIKLDKQGKDTSEIHKETMKAYEKEEELFKKYQKKNKTQLKELIYGGKY